MNEVSIDIVCQIPGHEEKRFSISTPDQNTIAGLIRKTCKENGIPMLSSYSLHDGKGKQLQWSHTLKNSRIQTGDTLYLSNEDEDVHVSGGCKWNSWWFVAAICILIGGVGITAIVLLKTKNGATDYQYGVVLDAGSSHTKLFIYKWDAEKLHETAVARQIHQCAVQGKGISSYTSNPLNVSALLKVCLDEARSKVPRDKVKTTPIFLGATAGMRMLNIVQPAVSDAILDAVRDTIKSYPFKFSSPESQARILSGEEEGTFGWVTANYASGILGVKPPDRDLTQYDQDKTLGALDMGGASTQITFQVGGADQIPNSYMEDLTLYGNNYSVYTHSYLCYGINEAIRRYMAVLVHAQGYNETNITNPCGPVGNITTASYTDVFEAPCANRFAGSFLYLYPDADMYVDKDTNYTFIGTGDEASCIAAVNQLFNFTANCTKPPCSFNGVYQPKLSGQFYAFSSFFYEMDFLNLTRKHRFSLSEFESSLSTLCNTSWDVVKTKKTGDADMLGWYCFEGHYIHTLLIRGYKFTADNWGDINFISKINKTDIGWTLGYMLNSSNIIPAGSDVEYITTSAFSALSVLFGIFLLLSIAFGCHAMKYQKRGGLYEQVPTYGAV